MKLTVPFDFSIGFAVCFNVGPKNSRRNLDLLVQKIIHRYPAKI